MAHHWEQPYFDDTNHYDDFFPEEPSRQLKERDALDRMADPLLRVVEQILDDQYVAWAAALKTLGNATYPTRS